MVDGRVAGIGYEIGYDLKRRRAEFVPCEIDVAAAGDAQVVSLFAAAAGWVAGFLDANPDWKANDNSPQKQ